MKRPKYFYVLFWKPIHGTYEYQFPTFRFFKYFDNDFRNRKCLFDLRFQTDSKNGHNLFSMYGGQIEGISVDHLKDAAYLLRKMELSGISSFKLCAKSVLAFCHRNKIKRIFGGGIYDFTDVRPNK